MSLYTLLHDSASQWPNRSALSFADRSWTFRELDELSTRVAAGLAARGAKPGDRIALLTPNCIELVLSYFGIFKLGAIAVPLNDRYRCEEAEYALRHCGATMLAVHEEKMSEMQGLPLKELGIRHSFAIGGRPTTPYVSYDVLTSAAAPADFMPEETASDEPAAILYTSGSTARPKGVTLTYGSLWRNSEIQSRTFQFNDRDVHLVATAACHCAAFAGQLLPAFFTGGTCILTHVPPPEVFVHAIEQYGVTRSQLLPTGLEDIVEYLEQHPGRNIKTWRVLTCGGDVVPAELHRRFQKITGFEATELYGLTEAVTTFTNPPFGPKRHGSIGKPVLETMARIVDEQGRDLPDNQTGELILQTPAMMRGYWNDPENTAAAIRDGWLYTGDLARRDADGYFWFVGRKKEIIIRGGSNISPMEVESVLDSHPAVHLSCVLGKPDAHFGQTVLAYVQLRNDVGQKPTAADLRQFAADRIAAYKVPEEIRFIEQMPLNCTGKVDRKQFHGILQREMAR